MPALTGSEQIWVVPTQANGQPSANQQQCSTRDIADLAGGAAGIVNTNITTVGNGTLTAAAIAGGLITRTGPTAVYTDTTDTAAAIFAALPGATVGDSFILRIKNGTAFAQTLAAGTGVTLPGAIVVAPESIADYLVVLTSATAVAFTHIRTTWLDAIPPAQFTTASLTAGTLAAALITGALLTVLQNTGATPGTQTTRTATQMLADFQQLRIGQSWVVRVQNTGAGTFTLAADASMTLTGTATIAQNAWRDFLFTITGTGTTGTIQNIGGGTL